MASEPVHVVRFGLIKCEVFRNQTRGGDRFNVTLTRLYRNGNVWQQSKVFGREDLLPLGEALRCAHLWIWEQCQADAPPDRGPSST